ncbi:MAG: NAD-dependent epimerase/dehydratase family protein [Lachnospiraceae bacterium]|nr:NAD-dependent epimerase/dehydratase family protein [Lachnospiraceae bacterium]
MDKNIIECPDNACMQEDMEEIARTFPFVDELKNSTIAVTGSTGLLGSQVVRALCAMNRIQDAGIRILAQIRSREKAQRVFGSLLDRGDIRLVECEISDAQSVVAAWADEAVDFIIHGAAPTGSRYFVEKPVETISAILGGTEIMLALARDRRVRSMVTLSSLEVYGTPFEGQEWMREQDFGALDPAQARSSYSEGKRMAECLCTAYAAEYDVPVKMVRLSQTFGPGVEYSDGRVFMDFARCALEGRDVILHTPGRTVRTYLYTRDAVAAILTVLARGEAGRAYNATNRDTAVSIYEMAELVCRIIGNGRVKARIEIPADVASFGYNPEMVIRLDPSALEALGWKATVGLSDMFVRMCKNFITIL